MPLTENVANVEKVVEKLKGIQGDKGAKIKSKPDDVLNKNKGWMTICTIADILKGSEISTDRPILTPNEITAFKNAPITSVDVERSFSRYKAILRPNRRRFTFENLKLHVVANNFKE